MKRDNPFDPPKPPSTTTTQMAPTKLPPPKLLDPPENDAGVDELLAVLGYKVRSSDMAEVAQKLEQLESVMGTVEDQDGVSSLANNDTVHYNPSDLSTWLESMLSEFNPNISTNGNSTNSTNSNSIIVDPSPSIFPDSDLKAIPGKAILTPSLRESKRLKTTTMTSTTIPAATTIGKPMVVVDSTANGVRLVHTLMACAEAIQGENLVLAEALVKQIGYLAALQAGSMRKVATYFAEALARRVYKLSPVVNVPYDDSLSDMLHMHFYETCPYLKFAHFTANQAILEAFSGKKRVHVIDFSMKQGMQWPALMQALALRPEGPPAFRLTGIGPPSADNTDRLQEVGWKLAQFADSIRIQFEYRGFVAKSLTDLEASMLDLRSDEVVAVNSVFELHRLLSKPGQLEKVLQMVSEVKPKIVTLVEQEANHNSVNFLERFNESLNYYSNMFDSLESCVDSEDKLMTEVYLGRQICNVVASDGPDRVERHETAGQWKARMGVNGFEPVHLGSNAFKQASMLLEFFAGGDGYGVEERDGCLMLGWHSRPLITTSAWQLGKNVVEKMKR